MAPLNITAILESAKAAEEAGFESAAKVLRQKAERARKLALAYEHFRFVKQEAITKFNAELKAKTERFATPEDEKAFTTLHHHLRWQGITKLHDELTFVALGVYPGLPPVNVLEATKAAKDMGCFDGFTVAEINPVSTQIKLPDPIVFGRIEGCTDHFFVAEWGTDVSIKDLLKDNEG